MATVPSISRVDIERFAELEQQVQELRITQIRTDQRMDRQDIRVSAAIIIAVIAAVGGTLFGVINFVLLLQLFARLG